MNAYEVYWITLLTATIKYVTDNNTHRFRKEKEIIH